MFYCFFLPFFSHAGRACALPRLYLAHARRRVPRPPPGLLRPSRRTRGRWFIRPATATVHRPPFFPCYVKHHKTTPTYFLPTSQPRHPPRGRDGRDHARIRRLTVEAVVDAVDRVFGGGLERDELGLVLLDHGLLGVCRRVERLEDESQPDPAPVASNGRAGRQANRHAPERPGML